MALTSFRNELIAVGSFLKAGGINVNRIAKWNGSTWAALGTGLTQPAYALTTYNNELIVGGEFSSAGGYPSKCWARWRAQGPFVGPDFNHDCDVDAADLTSFERCATGPALPYPANLPPGCTLSIDGASGFHLADFDQDHDIDQDDLGLFQRCYTAEYGAADPTCEN